MNLVKLTDLNGAALYVNPNAVFYVSDYRPIPGCTVVTAMGSAENDLAVRGTLEHVASALSGQSAPQPPAEPETPSAGKIPGSAAASAAEVREMALELWQMERRVTAMQNLAAERESLWWSTSAANAAGSLRALRNFLLASNQAPNGSAVGGAGTWPLPNGEQDPNAPVRRSVAAKTGCGL